MARPRFDPKRPLVAARSFTYLGVDYTAGAPFPTDGIAPYKLNTLYGSRAVNHTDEKAEPASPVQMKALGGGYFEVTAPWLDDPEKVRGQQKAIARVEELREAGEPDSYGGVSIEGGEGGWYTIEADWADEPEKIQGEDAARARAAALRAEGPYPDGSERAEIAQDEDTDKFLVSAPWLPGVEEYDNVDEAKARLELIRREGPPVDFDFEKAEQERQEREEADRKQAEAAAAEQAETSRRAAYSDAVTLSVITVDDVTTHSVSIPGVDEPETFETSEAATARQNELREAGPPKGWEAPAPSDDPAE